MTARGLEEAHQRPLAAVNPAPMTLCLINLIRKNSIGDLRLTFTLEFRDSVRAQPPQPTVMLIKYTRKMVSYWGHDPKDLKGGARLLSLQAHWSVRTALVCQSHVNTRTNLITGELEL